MGAGDATARSEDELVEEMEKELQETGDLDGFLKEFEDELDDVGGDTSGNDDLLAKLDDIVNGTPIDNAPTDVISDAPPADDVMPDEGAFSDVMPDDVMPADDVMPDEMAGDAMPDDVMPADDVMPDEVPADDALSDDIEVDTLGDDAPDVNDGAEKDDNISAGAAAAAVAEKPKKVKPKKEKKKGFLQSIIQSLFGKKKGDDQVASEETMPEVAAASSDADALSDENLQILQQLEGSSGTAEAEPEPEDTGKKKKKKEKKPKKEKKAKPKKEKKIKPKKEKKPKPPKEPDNTPPLPKKPVALILVMAASFVAFVLIGTSLFSYSNSFTVAASQYSSGDYEAAYQELEGLTIKDADADIYQKYEIMAIAEAEYKSYQCFMDHEIYDMALDTLIRTVGRCDKYSEEAETYGCSLELSTLQDTADADLAAFGVTEDQALELYRIEDRGEYSTEVNAILKAGGYKD